MPRVTVNGTDIHYLDVGEGSAVVLLHGFTGSSRNWDYTVPSLAGRHRLICPDLRGHGLSGRTGRPEDYRLEGLAQDVLALLDCLGVERFHLVGHSMGGMVAQHVALARPEALLSLVLLDTCAEAPLNLVTEERRRLVELAREQGMEAVFQAQLASAALPQGVTAQPELVQAWREEFLMTSREAYIYCAEAIARREPLLDSLSRLSAPALVVCGEDDEPFLEHSARMHAAMPGSRLVILEGCGHSPQMERPEEFNSLLSRFLAEAEEAWQLPERQS